MKLDNSINSFLHNSEILNTLESKTNINRKSLTIFGGLSICFIIYYIMGMGLVANLIGFLYPSYKSFKSLQSKKPDDDEQWLMYWIVYSFFNLIEIFTNIIFGWIPFYYQFKLIFLIWLAHDTTRGAQLIYKKYLEKYLITYEVKIDETMTNINKKVNQTINNQINNSIQDTITDTINNTVDNVLNNESESVNNEQDSIKKDK